MSAYESDHKIAKIIVSIIVIILLSFSDKLEWYEIAAIIVWIWGVNTCAYIIETIRHHIHKHGII